jgi:cytochrome bd-type quinol oxidase subunit 2
VEFLRNVLLVLHFLGLAALVGGFLVQMAAPSRGELRVVNRSMRDGAITQVVTGLLLVGVRYPLHDQDASYALPDNAKITVKLLVAVAVLVIVLVGRRRPEGEQQPYWAAAGGLAIVNVVVAVFW